MKKLVLAFGTLLSVHSIALAAPAPLEKGKSQVVSACSTGASASTAAALKELNNILLADLTFGQISIAQPYSASTPAFYSCGNYCECAAVTITKQ